jgi:hypothetical protein
MNSVRLNSIVEARIEAIRGTLEQKQKEYSSSSDTLHHFKAAARHRGITPEAALDGMMLKHEVSVADLVRDAEIIADSAGARCLIKEKIGDMINYLILLECLLLERLDD